MKGRMLSVAVVLVMLILPVTADARWNEVRQGTAVVGETHPSADHVLRDAQAPTHEALFRSGPMMFIQNAGQWDDNALFQVSGGSVGTMWLARDAIWITVLEPEESVTRVDRALDHRLDWPAEDSEDPTPRRGVNIKLSFVGANPQPHIESFDRLDTVVSYFYGNNPEQWRPDVPVWGGVRYVDLYPGIDLEFTNQDGHMVQRLTAQPEADLTAVKLRVEGTDSVVVIDDQLRLSTAGGTLDMPLLHAVGSIGETTVQPVGIRDFAISGPFATLTPAYHSPADNPADLLYGTYLGGSLQDFGRGIAVDGSDSAYVIGEAESSDFPIMPGAFDPIYNGGSKDVFVAKLNSDGSGLTYATFLGGSHLDFAEAITVGETGSAYLTGWTYSSDFPTTPAAFDPTFNNYVDAFVVKLNPTGSALVYATFLGGFGDDTGRGIAVDGVGSAYVTGSAASSDFPTTPGAFDPTFNGGLFDAFIAKLDPAGSSLVYATFLGGGGGFDVWGEEGYAIALDGAGSAYVTGDTTSIDFPTTPGAFDRTFNGGHYLGTDTFVARLNPYGDALIFSTFLGGIWDEEVWAIAVNETGSAYVTGRTSSSDFPTTLGAFDTTFNGVAFDAFVTKLNSDGSALAYSTFLGGSTEDAGSGIVVDEVGNAYVTGDTTSSDFPTTPGAFNPTISGGFDAFIAKLDPTGSALAYATFLGGGGFDISDAIALDEAGNVYLMGSTGSDDFPTSLGAFDPTYNGNYWDAFVVKLAAGGSQPCCDFDDDGLVDVDDIIIIADFWGQEIGEPYDQNDDGWITIIDVQRVARWWGWAVP